MLTDFCEVAKKKKVEIKPGQLKNSVVLFINSTIVNPSFDSQSKDFLTTPAAELGTSTPAEAREWFKDLHEIQYEWDEKTDESINLAFNKKQADDRKRWLSHYDPTKMLIPVAAKSSYTNFVNCELIHFSNADNIRSLPHVMDGLKPSQRKILFSCLKRNLRDEIHVAQLAGYVSEHAAYHHGEAFLNGTIVAMAQNFVGSNNVNLLKPVGQFGSRLMGGKDAWYACCAIAWRARSIHWQAGRWIRGGSASRASCSARTIRRGLRRASMPLTMTRRP